MSYCVNCGVELAPSEKFCPLCGVAPQNPLKPWKDPISRPFPTHVDKIVERVNRKYGVGLASLILLVPALLTLIIDFLSAGTVTWSLLVIGACVLIFVAVLLPILFKKPNSYLCILADAAVLTVFLASIEWIFPGENANPWALKLALPIVVITALLTVMFFIAFSKADRPVLSKFAVSLCALSLYCLALNILIDLFWGKSAIPDWSLCAAAPCLILSAIFFYTEKHKKFKDRIRRRLFY